MITPDLYTITATLHEDAAVGLYRGVRQRDGIPVIIKSLRSETPAPRELERLRHEYEIARRLDSSYLLKPEALETQQAQAQLIFEDFDGEPLSSQLNNPLELGRFLDIALQLAAALADIHRQGIVHKNIKPANILIQRNTGEVKLTDFGIAASLTHVPVVSPNSSLIEGTLAYMSPEQTGRMNRGVDHRSDLYSLGVTFYEMLTGALPFRAADPLEWVHCHIARLPRSPHEVTPDIPEPIASIVMKLLAKQAEERYQSARGLQADLQRCRAQWLAGNNIQLFPLGQNDVSDLFIIPRKLYGREQQVTALFSAFEQVAATGQTSLMLVSGYSGIGKSSLVQELQQPIARARGFFISGKFEQYQRDIPYAALSRAFRDLVQQILTENQSQIQHWQTALRQALGVNGQLIVDLIPQVELLIGPQPPVPELPPTEAQRRFHRVFQQFIGVFAQPEHPLALFLDDLQWLDPASLKLLVYLVTQPETQHLFLLGAYRDNEVGPAHPLRRTLDEIRQSQTPVQEVVLVPLTPAHLEQLVTETLHCPASTAAPLVRLVYDKTAGNPFFTIQFLTTLYQEGLLTYNDRDARWEWDLDAIHQQDFTDNVVELMVNNLKRFSAATQKTLTLAACIGHTSEAHTLALLCECPEEQIHATLRRAVDEGLVWRLNDSYKFLHDRVQEAAYTLIPEDERTAQHLRIGRFILTHTPEQQLMERIFEIVGQLNRGLSLITTPAEREQLAELDLIAGKRAKAATAFTSAINYFTLGASLLGPDAWETRHELVFALYLEQAQSAVVSGALDEAERLVPLLLEHARTRVEKAAVYRVQIDVDSIKGKGGQAIDLILTGLRLFGIDMSAHPSADEVQETHQAVWRNLGSRDIEELIDLPLMSDPEMKVAMELLARLYIPAYYSDQNLLHLHLAHAVNLSIQYGNAPASVQAYGWFGLILAVAFHRYQEGYRFAKLAFDLMERRHFLDYKAKAIMQMRLISLWTQSFDTALGYTRSGFEIGLAAGDVTTACMCSYDMVVSTLARGAPLSEVQRQAEQEFHFVRKTGFRDIYDMIASIDWFAQTMRGFAQYLATYDDDQCSEATFEAGLAKGRIPSLVCYYYIPKVMARFLFCDYEAALAAGDKVKTLIWTGRFSVQSYFFHFYYALALVAVFDSLASEQQQEALTTLAAHEAQLREWAASYPPTFQNAHALVAAEIARLNGKELEAERLYEQSIQSARGNGFVQNEGLGNELAGRFYQVRGLSRVADTYLREARGCYARWGADGKVQQLDRLYPRLAETQPPTSDTTFAARSEQLDLMSIIKASQAISREILLPNLQETLMRLVLEYAGAQRGYLLLTEGERLTIHAEAEVAGDETRVRIVPALPVSAALLPLTLLNYVQRTGESVLLTDAAAEGRYTTDEYILNRQPRSALGLPIIRQTQMVGLLYLENTLIANAFTPHTLTVLELLAAQAAVSLETASLYASLQQENAERKQAEEEVRQLNQGLEQRVIERTRQAEEAQRAAEIANRAKSAFLANMSHELRTPLNAILGYADILKRRIESANPLADGLDIIHHSGEHLLTLINDVLDLAKIEAGKLELNPAPLQLSAFLRQIVGIIHARAEAKDLALTYESVSSLPDVVLADETRLRQVLLNLLGNAVKFTDRGRVTLRVSANAEGRMMNDEFCVPYSSFIIHHSSFTILHFEVEDTGLGIPPDQLERIFQPFEQAGETDQRAEGTGLGLAISRQIVQLMGGQLQVKSQLGQGSVFWFDVTLPVIETATQETATPTRAIIGYEGARRKVLVADDKAYNRQMLVDLLVPLGFEVGAAGDGQEAVDKALAWQPDAIVLDLVMPVKTGFEAAQEIRQQPALGTQRVYIIAVSASVLEADQEKSRVAGCDAFLPKPIKAERLLDLLTTPLRLTWIYAKAEAEREAPLVPPPAEELAALYQLANEGRIFDIQALAVRLEKMGEAYVPFARHLQKLAKGFEIDQIKALIEQFTR